MQDVKYKPNLAAQMNEHEIPDHNGKWRNYYIWKDGATDGKYIYNSFKEAKISADKNLIEAKRMFGYNVNGKIKSIDMLVSIIQIPIK